MFSKLVIAFLMAYLARADDMTPLSACPLDPPTSFNLTCAVNLTCSWTLEGNGVETCTCEEEGTIECYALAPPISVISVSTCPPDPIFTTSDGPIPTCSNMSLTCEYEREVENPDAVGGYSCYCNEEDIFTCDIWEILAATAVPDYSVTLAPVSDDTVTPPPVPDYTVTSPTVPDYTVKPPPVVKMGMKKGSKKSTKSMKAKGHKKGTKKSKKGGKEGKYIRGRAL